MQTFPQLPSSVWAVSKGHSKLDPGAFGQGSNEYAQISPVVNYMEVIWSQQALGPLYVPHEADELPARVGLIQTVRLINAQKVKGTIELHFNAATNKHRRGGEVYYKEGSVVGGKKLAETIAARLRVWYPDVPCKVLPDTASYVGWLYFVRRTHAVAALVEPCFLSNVQDFNYLVSHWKALAETLCQGLGDFSKARGW